MRHPVAVPQGFQSPSSLAGRVLAAAPSLQDPNFSEALVFVVDHGPDGAMGLITNRPAGVRLGDVALGSGPVPEALNDVLVYAGGPVQSEGLLLAVFRQVGTEERIAGQVGLPIDEIASMLDQPGVWVRAFMGYSGWAKGQLEGEIAARHWIVRDPHPGLFRPDFAPGLWALFVSGNRAWRRLVPYLPADPTRN